MIDPNLLSYIKSALAQGKTREEITATLSSQGGWSQINIDAAFAAVQGGVFAPVNSITNPINVNISQNTNYQKSSGHWLVGLVTFIVTLVGTFFYWQMIIPNQTVDLAITAWFGLTLVVSILCVWMFAALFKASGQFSKALLFGGLGGVTGLIIQFSSLFNIPSLTSILGLLDIVILVIILKKVYSISVGKTIGLFICSGLVTVVISTILLFVLMFAGLFSLANILNSSFFTQPVVSESNLSNTATSTVDSTVSASTTQIASTSPTTCVDQPTDGRTINSMDELAKPVITSLSKSFGPVGTAIEIKGCNFNGFEGDLNVWVKNSQGISGILYSEPGSTAKSMKIILKPQACQTDESYRGMPCASFLNLTPGTYKISTSPWGNKSNEVAFTVTPSSVASPVQTPVNSSPKNLTCLNVKSVTYSGLLSSAENNIFFVGWGNLFIDSTTHGTYGTLDGKGWHSFPVSANTGTNSNLIPFAIAPFSKSGVTGHYQGGIMNIVCGDGKTVNAYIPDFVSQFGAKYADGKGNVFSVIYVANNGSTYYDSGLTKLARATGK